MSSFHKFKRMHPLKLHFFQLFKNEYLLTFSLVTTILTVLHAITPPGCRDTLDLRFAQPLELSTGELSHRTVLKRNMQIILPSSDVTFFLM